MTFRKIGGIYWLAIGRFRISFCRVRATTPSIEIPPISVPKGLLSRPVRYKGDLCNFGIGLKHY